MPDGRTSAVPHPAPRRVQVTEQELRRWLEARLGWSHARQRLGVEHDHEAHAIGQARSFLALENWAPAPVLIGLALRLALAGGRGRRNAARVALRRNTVRSARLPGAFSGFAILHLSDLHADMSQQALARAAELVAGLTYDICVLTGDFRGRTHGGFAAALRAMGPLVAGLKAPAYAVLGNHDTVRMLPALEEMGLRVLMNECETLRRGEARLHLAGVDDAHFYRMDSIEKAAAAIPPGEFALLLSHTPEVYRQAAHAGFDLMLSGHTHGGQICLPGGIPLTLEADLPRRLGAGAWRHHGMQGYTSSGLGTSVVTARFNCPPEITLHTLVREEPQ
jgi:predicted MPP superfamily phosphohydrolase